MAKVVLKNAYVTVNSVLLTTRAKSVTINYAAEALEANAMGDATKIKLAGLLDWSIDIEFYQDFVASGAGSVDATLFSLVGAAAFTIGVRADAGARATTNPEYSGSAILTSYNPITGTVGQMLMAPTKFEAAGDLSRLTA